MKLSHFQYDLPDGLLAEYPSNLRDEAKMMVLNRKLGTIEHKHFKDLVDYFDEDDILIFNNTNAALSRIQNVRVMVSSSPFTDSDGIPLGSDADDFVAAQQNATFLYDIGSDYNGAAATTLESIVTIEAETSGRYLRVQKSGTNLSDNTLNITEIQIFEACTDGIEAATIHNTSCGTANGSIDLTGLVDPTAGTTYSYTLYDGNDTTTPNANITGASTGIFTGLLAATYTVLAEESNTGCSTSQRVLTILDKPDKPFVTTS